MDDLLNHAPCGFISFTDEGRIVEVNATLLAMTGHTAPALVGHHVETVLALASRIFYQTHFFPLFKLHGKVEEIFLTLRSDEGEEIPVLANGVRRVHQDAAVNHCVFVPIRQRRKYEDEILAAKHEAERALRDNQALVQAQKELERHTRELDRQLTRLENKNQELIRISTVLSHDLQEPIRKLSVFADLLRREQGCAAPAQQTIARIIATCARMGELVKTLHHFVALDLSDEQLAPVHLGEVVEEARHEVFAAEAPEDVQFVAEPLPTVEGYRRQLTWLFYHLIQNALRFKKPQEPATIRITCTMVQHNSFQAIEGRYQYVDFAKIVFEDAGIGFDSRYSEYVFELFKTLHPGGPGLGCGLAICKKAVGNHYGNISVASAPGAGTRFTLLLPVRQHAEGPSQKEGAA